MMGVTFTGIRLHEKVIYSKCGRKKPRKRVRLEECKGDKIKSK